MIPRHLSFALGMAGLALASAVTPARADNLDLESHRVAFSGVTGTNGPQVSMFGDATFGTFAMPTINNAGQVAFTAGYTDATSFNPTGGTNGVWRFTPGVGVQLVAQAFGAGNPTTVDEPFLDVNGNIAFRGFAPGGSQAVFYRSLPSALDVSSRTGVAGAEGPDLAGLTYNNVAPFTNSMVFRNGHAAYHANLLTGTNGVTSANDDVLVRSDNGAQAVTYARQSITGTNPLGPGVVGRTWQQNFTVNSVNSRGDITFLSGFGNDAAFGQPSMFGKIDGVTGAVTFIAVGGTTGATGPNIPGSPGSTFTFITGSGRIGLNDAGDTVYFGRSGTASPNVLLKNVGGTPVFIADVGDTLDGVTITNFSSGSDPIIAGNGDVFFEAGIGNVGNTALFRHNAGGFDLLALTGDLNNGPLPGVRFGDISSLAANAVGDLAFYASIFGAGVTSANDEVIMAIHEGVMKIIVREGDLFDVDPTDGVDLRTIRNLVYPAQLVNTGGQDGRRSYINDSGVIVFGLTFTDFSSGIFTVGLNVPEPSTLGLLALGAAGLLRRRR